MSADGVKWLLIDSSGGAAAMMALGRDDVLIAEEAVAGRTFSAMWTEMLQGLLGVAGWRVEELQLVGLVNGPGSFTGVRVGLAAAKGLCEATGAALIAISRLEVLQGGERVLAVMDAGRDEFYVRDGERESLMGREALAVMSAGREVVTTDARVGEVLSGARMVELKAASALGLVLQRWSRGERDDVAAVDANYVRGEKEIYGRGPAGAGGGV